jgi:hypothetical protein
MIMINIGSNIVTLSARLSRIGMFGFDALLSYHESLHVIHVRSMIAKSAPVNYPKEKGRAMSSFDRLL